MKINLDIQSVRSFVKVAELGSFTRASNILNLTQPAISQQIRRMEELLGVELFSRSNKSIFLTLDGEKLLNYAHDLIAVNDKVGTLFAADQHKAVVTMGLPEHFCESILPQIISSMTAALPHVQLVVKVARSALLNESVDNGTIDLGLVIEEAERVQEVPWQNIAVSWYASEQLDVSRDNLVSLVLFRPPCGFRSLAISSLEKSGIEWRCVYESEDLMSLRSAVAAGAGVTLLPVISDLRGLKPIQLSGDLQELPKFSVALRQRPGWNPSFKKALISIVRDIWIEGPHQEDASQNGQTAYI